MELFSQPLSLTTLLVNVIICSLYGWLMYTWSQKYPLRKHLFPALLIKIIAGIGLGLIYRHHYEALGDTFSYFHDAQLIAAQYDQSPIAYLDFITFSVNDYTEVIHSLQIKNPRGLIFSKLASVSYLLSENYWLMSIHFSLFSFLGSWQLANRLTQLFKGKQLLVAISFFYFPSFVFWSSGLLKESVLIGSLFLLMAWLLQWIYAPKSLKLRGIKIGLGLLFLYLIFKMKYYYLAAFIPCIGLLLIAEWLDKTWAFPAWKKYMTLFVLLFMLAGLASFVHPNLHADQIITAIVTNNLKMAAETENQTALIQFEALEPNLLSLLQHMPTALWEGLFRPYIWEKGHLFWRFTAFENTLILLLCFGTIRTLVFSGLSTKPIYQNIIIFSLLYILVLAVLLSLAAPNLGNLVRYKTGFMPFLIYLLLHAAFFQKKSITQPNKF
ncbi:MAG: hypothetical protein ACPGJS_21140 [Flammeovirgaceae bacterium]